MNRTKTLKGPSTTAAAILTASRFPVPQAHAQECDEVKVMISCALNAPLEVLTLVFETRHGVKVATINGPSMTTIEHAWRYR